MKQHFAIMGILMLFCCSLPGVLQATEIWRCGSYYSNELPSVSAACSTLKSSLICGKNGNKYIAPSRQSLPTVNKRCQGSSEKERSPLVLLGDEAPNKNAVVSRSPLNMAFRNMPGGEQRAKDSPSSLPQSLPISGKAISDIFSCASSAMGGNVRGHNKCLAVVNQTVEKLMKSAQ